MCYPVGMSALDTYAPDRIGYRYGTPDSAYSKGYHRGQDVRKLNEAGTASVVTDVEAIDDGVVVYVGRPNGLLARTVVIDTGRARGRYESHSHMADISVGHGQRVSSGDRLGRNAKMSEDRGFIDGVHDHVTITDYPGGAWETWRGEYDPLPFMQAAYARANTSHPTNPVRQSEEDNIMLMLRIKVGSGTHLCALGNGVFRHFVPQDPYDKVMKVSRSADDWQDITLAELPAFLRTYGCDLNIWDIRGGAFVILDPLDGSVRSGNVWTAVNAARSTVAQVKVTSEQTAAYIKTLSAA